MGKSVLVDADMEVYFGGFCSVLRFDDPLLSKYVSLLLKTPEFRSYVESQLGQNINNLGKEYLLDFKIPLAPPNIIHQILDDIFLIEQREHSYQLELESVHNELRLLMQGLFDDQSQTHQRLGVAVEYLQRGKTPKYGFSPVQVIKSGQIRGYEEFDFTKRHYVSKDFPLDERLLKKGDLLINSTGVGTAGRVNYFDLDGRYVVDGHVSILRLNPNLLLPKYALYCFAQIGFESLEQMAEGRSGQVELSPEAIKSLRFPLIGNIERQNEVLIRIEELEIQAKDMVAKISKVEESKLNILKKYLSS